MNLRSALIAQVALAATLLASPGLAGAVNNYSGFQCIPLTGSVQPNSNGHVQNSSAANATVMCPVLVENSVSGLATSGRPLAHVTDQNFNANVCCSSRVKNNGQSVVSGGTACSTGTNPLSQSVPMVNPATPGGNFTFTHRWLQCDIPPVFSGQSSEIRTYHF